jgi:hypothetical protein
VGAFVHRSADGNGTLTCTAMSLKWDYAATGLGGTNAVDVSVHAIEMVYIPPGVFWRTYQAATLPAQTRFAGSGYDGYVSSSWRTYQPATQSR